MWIPEYWRICTKSTPGSISPQHKSVATVIAAIPENFRQLFLEAEAMVISAHGYTSSYSEIRAIGAVPLMRHVLSNEYRETIHKAELVAQQHLRGLTHDLVLAEINRVPVELVRSTALDNPEQHIVGFRVHGTEIDRGFTIVTFGNPSGNAGVIMSRCRGFCYEQGLWLIEPSDIRGILKEPGAKSVSRKLTQPGTFMEIHEWNRQRTKTTEK